MLKKTIPINRNEEEVLGYKDVLNTIHENFDDISITPNVILQLHHDLFGHVKINGNFGKRKATDNTIVEINHLGNKRIRFKPTTAYDTPKVMQELCKRYNDATKKISKC
jgi:Fic family protein